MSRSRMWSISGLIIAVTVGLDQLTKEWATNRLSGGRVIEVLPSVDLRLVRNSGFSFSTGSGRGPLVGLLVIGVCLFIVRQLWRETVMARAALFALILGGALGNLIDRVFRADDGVLSGKVIDFIDVDWYAVFNVADSFVVCGCIAFVIYEIRHQRRDDEPAAPAPDTTADNVSA